MEDNENKGEEQGSEDTGEGDKSKTPQSIVDANLAAERMEKATEKHKEQLDRQEDMIARKILGGTTEAGGNKEEKVKTLQEAAKEYIDKNFANLK